MEYVLVIMSNAQQYYGIIGEYNVIKDNKLIQVFLAQDEEGLVEAPQTQLIPPPPPFTKSTTNSITKLSSTQHAT